MSKLYRLALLAALALLVALLPAVAAASAATAERTVSSDGKTLIKEFEFTASGSDFSFDAPRQAEVDGKQYVLTGIKGYRVDAENRYSEKTVHYKGLPKKEVPEQIEEGGAVLTLAEPPHFETHETTVQKTFSGTAPGKIKVEQEDGSTVQASLREADSMTESIGTVQATGTEDRPFTIKAKFIGAPGVVYEFEGRDIDLGDGKTPAWQGHEAVLASYFGLEDGASITGGKWTSGYKKVAGETVRYAEFTGTEPVRTQREVRDVKSRTDATYAYETYSCEARYANGEAQGMTVYTVVATAEYEKAGMPEWLRLVLMIGAAVLVLTALAVVVLWLISLLRRRKGRRDAA